MVSSLDACLSVYILFLHCFCLFSFSFAFFIVTQIFCCCYTACLLNTQVAYIACNIVIQRNSAKFKPVTALTKSLADWRRAPCWYSRPTVSVRHQGLDGSSLSVFHLHGVVDAELIHDRCPVMTAHALVEVKSKCHGAGMVVVLVRGRCNDYHGARRKSLADDDCVPPVTLRTSPAGVTHDCWFGGSALVIWSERSSTSSSPVLWRAAGLLYATSGLPVLFVTVRCRPLRFPICLRLP